MRTYTFSLAALLALAVAFPAFAAEKPRAAQGNQTKKIWTNEDLDQLHARGLISIVGPEATAEAPQSAAAVTSSEPSEPARSSYNSRLEDPDWYAQKAADLQAELEDREAELQKQRMAIALAPDRITQPGIALDKPTYGITPQAGLAVLEAQVDEIQAQLDDLSNLARQNDIVLDVLRS